MTIHTCYLFTDTGDDQSVIETIFEPYKDIYSAFVFDSQELNACLIPRIDKTFVESTSAKLVNRTILAKQPPDMFITNTSTPYLVKARYTHNYIEQLQETVNAYAEKNGVITSVICLMNDIS